MKSEILPASFAKRASEEVLSKEELRRYSRHVSLPDVGLEGQKRLKAARVFCVGTGGLGSPVTMYLAAAGIGTLGIIDFDVVDVTNLQRQIIHGQSDVGRLKVESARESLLEINPHLKLNVINERLTRDNALQFFNEYDIIVDGTDNFATRYLVNDACVLLSKPNVYGSIFQFDGMATVFAPGQGPCYRCMYPDPPPPGMVPSCAEGGVLGILPGVIGVIQATEAVKLILGKGDSLVGRLLSFNALSMKFKEFKLVADDSCPICGKNPTITALVDYEAFCGLARGESPSAEEKDDHEIAPKELERWMKSQTPPLIVDVREPHEYEIANIGAKLVPLSELEERCGEIPRNQDVVLHCHHGGRSRRAMEYLKKLGYTRVKNLTGGIDRWSCEVDPALPRY